MADGSYIKFDAKELATLGAAFKVADLPAWKALNKELRKIITPIANQVKDAALALPSSGDRRFGPGLRGGIAAAVEVKMSTTRKKGAFARIRVSGTKFMKASGITNPRLPRYMEGLSKKPWRHPVWADKGKNGGKWEGRWTVQASHPYLVPTGISRKDEVRDKMATVFNEALANQLNKSTKS